jgi:hypothetical protein
VQANASKLCLSRGEWFRDQSNTTWTNYSLCFSDPTITVPVNFSEVDNNPLISVSKLLPAFFLQDVCAKHDIHSYV